MYLRFNVPTQVSVTGYGSDFATLLSGGGDVHFRIYSSHLYQVGLYQLDGTLLGYIRVDVPGAMSRNTITKGDGGGSASVAPVVGISGGVLW